MPVTTAVQVYVCEPPMMTPTGRYLGTGRSSGCCAGRRPPRWATASSGASSSGPICPNASSAARLAAYNLVSVAVCDEDGRLLGAVTVDDVLDHLLPVDWRKKGG